MPRSPGTARVTVNCWFIKHSNGLFYYALDYAVALGSSLDAIWVRSETLELQVRKRIPAADVRTLSGWQMVAAALANAARGKLLFTPSAHPLPLPIRQVVVVHDCYPFVGESNRTKRRLFEYASRVSRAGLGFINRSDAREFLVSSGFSDRRMAFLPNPLPDAVPGHDADSSAVAQHQDRPIVGLFGTDSPKKDYETFLQTLAETGAGSAIKVAIYGHENAYVESLRERFGAGSFELVQSGAVSLADFIAQIDIAASIARGEGFARPVALALMAGKRALLLDTPVFREFYDGSAKFFESPRALVDAVICSASHPSDASPSFAREQDLRDSFAAGIAWLKTR